MVAIKQLDSLERKIHAALGTGDETTLHAFLATQHPADIADVVDRLGGADEVRVFRLLSPGQAAAVLDETSVEATRALIGRLPTPEIVAILNRMASDDVAELLGEDVPDRQDVLLTAMDADDAFAVRALLTYPQRCAGRIMTPHFVQVRPSMTVAATLAALRELAPAIESVVDLYALDEAGHLQGLVRLRNVLAASPTQTLAELLDPQPVSVLPDTDQEEVARIVAQYDLLTVPVVQADGRMLGIITVDDVIDVFVQESTEDVLRFGAVQSGVPDESYFATPISRAVRRRIGWLLILFLTGTLTINVLARFEHALEQVVALSFFIPLLIGTGGNTGAQTVSTMVRGMALGEIRLRDIWRVLGRELSSGLVLGSLLAIVALLFALILSNPLSLALVVALSIIAVCTWANLIGALVPLLAHRFGLDPALVSAPLITTLVDVTGLAIYLLIAKMLLGL